MLFIIYKPKLLPDAAVSRSGANVIEKLKLYKLHEDEKQILCAVHMHGMRLFWGVGKLGRIK